MNSSAGISSVRPTPGYLYTISLGSVGLPFMGIGLGGSLIGRAGGDPDKAMNVDGFVLFILGFAILFSMRLLFWAPAPPLLRGVVRAVISTIFIAGVPLALLGLILALQLPSTLHHTELPIVFSILALLCQPLAILWLVRYRREGI